MEKLTPKARLDFLVQMVAEAWDRTHGKWIADPYELTAARRDFLTQARERLSQCAQVWTIEADEA